MNYITFSTLGNHGRLGNAMFQYAALKAISFHLQCNAKIPDDLEYRIHHGQKCLLYCFNIDCERIKSEITSLYIENNKGGYYDSGFWNCQPGTDLFGHYESELYFENIKENIKKEFQLKNEFQNFAINLLNNIKQPKSEIVGIHIRRGDKANEIEKNTLIEYINKALLYFIGEFSFIIFSGGSITNNNIDDIYWCKENLKIDCYYSNNDTIHDFSLMVNCDHLILCSTSTIGWWAGYLNNNPNKKIIVPKQGKYITGEYIKGDTFYSKEFIQIK